MASMRCNVFSEVLGLSTSMTVILPQSTRGQIGMTGRGSAVGAPVLYLLHGLSDDDTIWSRRTSVERYAAEKGLAVVMPRVERSFYSDEVHGGAYWTFLSQELPAIVGELFRVSDAREDTFVAGLSMGGYGAGCSGGSSGTRRFAGATRTCSRCSSGVTRRACPRSTSRAGTATSSSSRTGPSSQRPRRPGCPWT